MVADAVAAAFETRDVLWREVSGGTDGAVMARLMQLTAILDAPGPEASGSARRYAVAYCSPQASTRSPEQFLDDVQAISASMV